MSGIKSKRAKEALFAVHRNSPIGEDIEQFYTPSSVKEAIIIAETEADKRHAKHLQELRDVFDSDKYHLECNHQIELQELNNKAVEAFASICKSNLGYDCERCAYGIHSDYCRLIELFTQKLTEK